VVSGEEIQVDESKVEAIKSWATPTSIMKVRSFYRLAFSYRRFIKYFSSIVAPLIECMKKGSFEWTKAAQRAFEKLRRGYIRLLSWLFPTLIPFLKLNMMLALLVLGQFSPKPNDLWPTLVRG